MFKLVFRNFKNQLKKTFPVALILIISTALLFMGNAIFEASDFGLRKTFVENLSGDIVVSGESDEGFTLFGSEIPLVGEYLIPPVIQSAALLNEFLQKDSRVLTYTKQVTSGALVSVRGLKLAQPVFGLDFLSYVKTFKNIKLVLGEWPKNTSDPIIFLSETRFNEISKHFGKPLPLGASVILTVANNSSFTIREVKFSGVFRYPVQDEILDRLALIDVDTARALNGYVNGEVSPEAEIAAQNPLLDMDIESLFSSDSAASEGEASSLITEKPKDGDDLSVKGNAESQTDSWNHYLIRLKDSTDPNKFLLDLKVFAQTRQYPWLIRDWREAVGGFALIAWFLRIVMNGGILFIAFGSLTIVVNAMALSVLERTKEIGTMRALGARKIKIASIIGGESFLIIMASGVFGIILGVVLSLILNLVKVPLENSILQALFGGDELKTIILPEQIVNHFELILALALGSVIYPVLRALKLSPLRALEVE